MVTNLPRSAKDFEGFVELKEFETLFVEGSEVVWAQYENLKRDFPHLKDSSEAEIDAWIIKNFAYISKYQVNLTGLRNTEIPVGKEKETAYRHYNYLGEYAETQGRGDVMPAFDFQGKPVGLIDRKGAGVSKRKLEETDLLVKWAKDNEKRKNQLERFILSNGLLILGEAFVEALKMELLQRSFDILNHEKRYSKNIAALGGNPLQSVEGYFVLKFPFFAKAGSGQELPVALYGRQAHIGRIWAGQVFTDEINVKQSDLFGANVDAGTIRIRLPEVKKNMKQIKGYPEYDNYKAGYDWVEAYQKGDKKILHKKIEEIFEPLNEKYNKIKKDKKIEVLSSEERFVRTLKLIQDNPKIYFRYCFSLYSMALEKSPLVEKYQATIADIAKNYLSFPITEIEAGATGFPLRRWGQLLIPLLPKTDRMSLWEREVKASHFGNEQLALAALLMPQEELQRAWKSLVWKSGQWLWAELNGRQKENKLKDGVEWAEKYDKLAGEPYWWRMRSTLIKTRKEARYYSLPRLRNRTRYWT